MPKYTELHEWDRKQLHAEIADIAHKSDEFFNKLQELIKDYSKSRSAKLGIGEVTQQD